MSEEREILRHWINLNSCAPHINGFIQDYLTGPAVRFQHETGIDFAVGDRAFVRLRDEAREYIVTAIDSTGVHFTPADKVHSNAPALSRGVTGREPELGGDRRIETNDREQ